VSDVFQKNIQRINLDKKKKRRKNNIMKNGNDNSPLKTKILPVPVGLCGEGCFLKKNILSQHYSNTLRV
jgi:hypothetical protein